MPFLTRLLFESPVWRFVLMLWALMILKSGVGVSFSFEAQVAIAENPFFNPIADPGFHFLLWTWLSSFVAWSLGCVSPKSLFWFYFASSTLFYFLFVFLAFRHLKEKNARLSLLIFTAMPVSSTAYYWVCADSFTLLLMMLTLALTWNKEGKTSPQRLMWAFLMGVFLGLQDFEKIAIATFLWGAFNVYLEKQGEKSAYSALTIALVLIGAIVGKFLLVVLFAHYGVNVNSGRLYWLEHNIPLALKYIYFNLPATFYCALAAAWFFVALYIFKEKHGKVFGFILLAYFSVLLIAMDHTRVFAILSLFLVAQVILLNPDFLEKIPQKTVEIFFIAWLVLPFVWVFRWIQFSMLPYDISLLAYRFFGVELPMLEEAFPYTFVPWMAF